MSDPDVERSEKMLRKWGRMDRKRERQAEEQQGDQDEHKANVLEVGEDETASDESGPVQVMLVEGTDERFRKESVAVNEETFEDMVAACEEIGEYEDGGKNELEEDWGLDPEDEEDDGKPGEMDEESRRKGRMEELDYMVNVLEMFEFGDYEEATRRGGGRRPTTTKWVEGWKKDEESGGWFVRSRLVGRDFRTKGEGVRNDLFAAMPPLEAKKVLFRMTAGERGWRRRRGEPEVKLMFIDVKKAHLNAVCEEDVWVELPPEFWEYGKYARLRRWLYGMRKAAAGWEDNYAGRLESVGFRRGIGAPTVFYNPKTGVRVVVHGDDFTFAGVRGELEKMRRRMAEWYEVKERGIMGSDEGELKEVVILGRTVRWTREGLEYEADGKHRKTLMRMMGIDERSNIVGSPSVKEGDGSEWLSDDVELQGSDRRRYREMTARLNYLGQDRSDVQYATKELCTEMSRPTEGGLRKLKRVVRYLAGAESVVWRMGEWGDGEEVKIDVYVDSDWAKSGDRKSTSGGLIALGGVGVKHWSRSQRSRALSVGEAEYYALVSGSAEGLGLRSLLEDLGWDVRVRVWTDSSTAQSVAGQGGLGKLGVAISLGPGDGKEGKIGVGQGVGTEECRGSSHERKDGVGVCGAAEGSRGRVEGEDNGK